MLTDRDKAFFVPVWRRIAVVVFCAVWAGWEWSQGEDTWALMVGGIGAFSVWLFFIRFDVEEAKKAAEAEKAEKAERARKNK